MFCLTLPNCQNRPSQAPERPVMLPVTFDIGESLRSPEVCIRRWHNCSILAVVQVKEAAMYVDDLSMSNENDVRPAWKVSLMEAISVP